MTNNYNVLLENSNEEQLEITVTGTGVNEVKQLATDKVTEMGLDKNDYKIKVVQKILEEKE